MAFFDVNWYANSVGYTAVSVWTTGATIAAGALRRQTAPAVGSERVFVCIIAGTTNATTEPTWVLTRGAKTTDNTVTWQECTGASAVNGDLTNTPNWAAVKAGGSVNQGVIIKRNNGASYHIATVGPFGPGVSEPAFSDTAGATVSDSTGSWTCLGPVGNFTGGQAPFARLASACASTWFAAGNTIYVGDNHAESQATQITMSPTGTAATVGRLLCHNHSGSYPPAAGNLTTGAVISTTGAANIVFSPVGAFYLYGLSFRVAVGQSSNQNFNFSTGNVAVYCDNCSIEIATTAAGGSIIVGGSGTVIFNNTVVKFANAGQAIAVNTTQFFWQNTGQVLASGSSVSANLIGLTSIISVVLEAIDLSQITGNIISTASAGIGAVLIKDCKLNASVTIQTPVGSGQVVQLVRCDSGATGYKSARYTYEGTETTETSIVRTGGAVDPTGQAQSRKIVTTANSQWLRPFKAEPYAQWNPTTGANVTVTVYGTVNAGALPNNDDIWLECEYLGSATDPLGKIVTTTKASVLASNAAVASDSSVWANASSSTVYSTWDPATVTAVTLSGGNLVATNTGTTSADQGAQVTNASGKTTGKYYFEVGFTNITSASANLGVGIAATGSTYTGMGNGGGITGIEFYRSTSVWASGGVVLSGFTASPGINTSMDTGDIVGIAIDLDNRKAWFRTDIAGAWNNNASANPVTNVGGLTIPAGTMVPMVTFGGSNGAASQALTANLGASAFAGVVPSGFTAGWGTISTWTPFKLTATLSSPQPQLAGYLHARARAAKPSTTYYIDPQITLS